MAKRGKKGAKNLYFFHDRILAPRAVASLAVAQGRPWLHHRLTEKSCLQNKIIEASAAKSKTKF